jgi:hypothetical protein
MITVSIFTRNHASRTRTHLSQTDMGSEHWRRIVRAWIPCREPSTYSRALARKVVPTGTVPNQVRKGQAVEEEEEEEEDELTRRVSAHTSTRRMMSATLF